MTALTLCIFFLSGTTSAALPDVTAESPSASAVAELLSGYPDGRLCPARTFSAAQFVTIAARCAGLEPVPAQANHQAAGSLQAALQAGWYDWDEPVLAAYAAGVVTGDAQGNLWSCGGCAAMESSGTASTPAPRPLPTT